MTKMTLTWSVEDTESTYTISSTTEITIGRLAECEIALPDPSVSRKHAAIYHNNGVFYLRNLSQVNPVYIVNDHESEELPYNQSKALELGTKFQVGPIQLTVSMLEDIDVLPPKIRCTNCEQLVDSHLTVCPWCGASLASILDSHGGF